jgi:hypothetical protein
MAITVSASDQSHVLDDLFGDPIVDAIVWWRTWVEAAGNQHLAAKEQGGCG